MVYRKDVPFVKEDEFLHDDIMASISFLTTVAIDNEELLS
jgi:hypothetical protein